MRLIPLLLLVLVGCSAAPHRPPVAAPAAIVGKKCEIAFSAEGATRVRGENEIHMYACLGYAHGRDRAFQMDFFRRAAQGRLAEILGTEFLKPDFFLRTVGLFERAQALWASVPEADRGLLSAYAYGVNQGFAAAKDSVDLKTLGYEPEPWHPEDSLAVLLIQSFRETQQTFWQETKEAKHLEKWGDRAEKLFVRDGLPWDVSILKLGEFPEGLPKAPKRGEGAALAPPPVNGEGMGSNSWVVAPGRSVSGKAWLANDPHLELVHPPFWYAVALSSPEGSATGASLPGYPVIPSGFNQHVAWGLTNAYLDAGDVVAVPEEKTRDLPRIRPTIWIRFGPVQLPFFFKSYQRTGDNLPVLPLEGPPGHSLVLDWTGYAVTAPGIVGLRRIFTSRSVKEADEALAAVELPSWNYVFADTAGGIGYRAQGKIFRRTEPPVFGVPKVKELPRPGRELFTTDEMPHVLNPARGYVVTGNNRQWPVESAFHGGRAYRQGLRAFRIEERLLKTPKHDLATLQEIQCDTQAVDARFLVPRLLKWVDRNRASLKGPVDKITATWRAWNYSAGVDCKACGFYERFLDRVDETMQLDVPAVYVALEDPAFVDEGFRNAWNLAVADLQLGEGDFRPWGELHLAFFRSLSRSPRFEPRLGLSTGGNAFSPNPGSHDWDETKRLFRHTLGASQRLLVELTTPPRAWYVLAGANRGYGDRALKGPWEAWRDCRYKPLSEAPDGETVSIGF